MGSFRELMTLPTIDERFLYLRRQQRVGEMTFGGSRYLNQSFYASKEWKNLRHKIVLRDGGWDLGVEGYPVGKRFYIHHINPLTIEQVVEADPCLFDPDNLILCSLSTHNAIHYGTGKSLEKDLITRSPGDTKLW